MKLTQLTIPNDALVPEKKVKKEPTEFERKRAAAVTYEQLVHLGYEEDFDHPEGWADHVMAQRERYKS